MTMPYVDSISTDLDRRLDLLTNIDVGGRGVEGLLQATRAHLKGGSPVGAAANMLAGLNKHATVLYTTGSVSRAWISADLSENDGPAGTATLARALTLALSTHNVVVCEASLIDPLSKIFTAAGLAVLSFEQAKHASLDGTLPSVCFEPFTVDSAHAESEAAKLLDKVQPDLLLSCERVGRASDGVYYSMRAVDYGRGRARVDYLFDAALARKLPSLCIGDGGNEIGMGLIAAAVREHVKHGATINSVTSCDVLVTAACSNWGCAAIAAALAVRFNNKKLAHHPELESYLLDRGVDIGLLNAADNLIDPNVDGIPKPAHVAMSQLIHTLATRAIDRRTAG